ncbi:MAG: hypothetical protein C5S49_05060 [Candidatus Methanogaster sp.]|nr:MAG: hypothetical protein C5S49_05060 [ANME-2 cluster archaeon]
MLITIGLSLSIAIGIGDTIALAGLAKGLIGRIGEKDAFGILKKALDKTIKEAEDAALGQYYSTDPLATPPVSLPTRCRRTL